jgi:alginate O-acetyltransferase complex protein AlgI
MIFNELAYFVLFLLPSVALFHWVSPRFRPWVLSGFGALFFAYFGYLHFGGLAGACCVLLFLWEIVTSRLYRPGSRWCLFGIVQAVFILFAFKYVDFAARALADVTAALHLPAFERPARRVWLPLGISFFTFEFIHFAADSYSGKIERSTLADYAAFILFFPSMVAGPIKRYQNFVPKLRAARFDSELAAQGITRILAGLVKKHLLADTFALWAGNLNGAQFFAASPEQLAWWLLSYGFQIYLDFSAYSDIAIGSGYLFGIVIPENFDWPYGSRNIGEFWRRWHISLGSWIRDYIYVPLGGSHGSENRTATNLIAAFLVSGLWHGAAYNFVIWGAWHGVLLVVHRRWARWWPRGRIPDCLAVVGTFIAVNLGWAFFAMDAHRALITLGRLARWS